MACGAHRPSGQASVAGTLAPASTLALLAACSWHIAGDRRVRMRVRARATAAVCGWGDACVRSGSRQRRPWGLVSLEDVCAAGCAVQEGGRAGSEEGELGEHAAIAEERAVLCAMLPCCPDSLAAHEQRGCGQALGVPPHSTAQAAACRFVEESGAGVAGAGCDGAESAADAVSAAPPSGTCGGGASAVGSAPERGDGGERCPVSSVE